MSNTGTLVGYARCSKDPEDLAEQQGRLRELGVAENHIYYDQGLTGTDTERPGLDQALAAVGEGDTLVAPKLDRLARSVPDACAIGEGLAKRGVSLSLGGQLYDPAQPMGKMFFEILATVAEFEIDLLRTRSREGLTGLTTIPETLDRLKFALDSPRVHGPHLGVLLCAIDDFYKIEETWGQAYSNIVLANLAMRMRRSVRQGDTVGRISWDAALILLPGVHSLDNVTLVAEKIRGRAEEPILHSGVTIHATLSIGATLAVPGESESTLRARAEEAMEAAKRDGGNQCRSVPAPA
ncbi:MAG: recombinase family protein [Mycobacterium sp.]